MTKIDKPEVQDRIAVIDDEKKRVIDFWDTNLPVPSPGIFDEPTRCYRINEKWAAVVMGFVSWLTEIAAWKDAQDESYPAIVEILKFLEGGNCDMPFILRQNPENSCLIEQSTDGGETWLTAFDLSLCMSIVDGSSQTSIEQNFVITNLEQYQEYVYNNYINNYINNVTDLAPELGYDDTSLDDFRDAALCYALTALVDAVCEGAIRYIAEREETANDLKNTLAMTAAIVGIVAIASTGIGLVGLAAGATLWGAGIGLGAAFGSALVDKWADATTDTYEDAQAKEDVVCCLLETLKGANFNQSNFIDAFEDDCGLTGNAAEIFDTTAAFARENATYASMVEKLRIGYNSAKYGLLPNCGCDEGESYIEYDFTLDSFGFTSTNGQWVQGQGWVAEITEPSSGNYRATMVIQKNFIGALPIGWAAGFVYDALSNCGIEDHSWDAYLDGNEVIHRQIGNINNGDNNHIVWTNGTSVPYVPVEFDNVRFRVNAACCGCGEGKAIIKKVRIWLSGNSPLRGVSTDVYPEGLGPGGTSSLIYWE